MKTTVYLNIGSNSGDRRAFIARAVAALVSAFPVACCRTSDIVESEPWGYESAQPFLNIGLALSMERDGEWTEDNLLALLDAVQEAERSVSAMPHRNADGSYRDREVDIDIIAVDDIMLSLPRLTLPHPRMALRSFVLKPMAQLAPEWRHPGTGLSSSQMLEDISR